MESSDLMLEDLLLGVTTPVSDITSVLRKLKILKKDGSWRMCVDSMTINMITVKYRFPIFHLDDMLDQLSGKFVVVYFDDILIYSSTWASYFVHLRAIFDMLRMERFVVSTDGVYVDQSKIEAILNWPKIKTLCDDRSFHGLWTDKVEASFQLVKKKMTEALALAFYDFEKVFEVNCDASEVGIGGILSQEREFILVINYETLKYINGQHKLNTLSCHTRLLTTMSTRVVGFETSLDMYAADSSFGKII
ncbi:uncharacterized protein LOC111387884 [Olea europaea var. sylvestris]|uniref:uncharacterized protein LOC111387884 n=1 Tax=Olea europaea var. sylvestris TaxID=158386 RepID=UPI000C1D44A0|nr:uncharacterized protein LOC111387884 [Olea europaea var. sylvestris]